MGSYDLIMSLEKEIDQHIQKGAWAVNEQDQIVSLRLDNKNLVNFPITLLKFRHLQSFSFAGNFIEEIHPDIANLRKLAKINAMGNRLAKLPDTIQELDKLVYLNLNQNLLTELPPEFSKFRNLRELLLAKNQLKALPGSLVEIKSLQLLDVSQNRLTHIPPEFNNFEIPFKWEYDYEDNGLYFEGNPLIAPPMDVFREGDEAIHTYLENSAARSIANKEQKCYIIGPKGSGKTSFINVFCGNAFNPEEAPTKFLDISRYNLNDGKNEVNLHFWDSSGNPNHEAYHDLFLTDRSLYFVVVDPESAKDIYDYLYRIQYFTENSKVIVVVNKQDTAPIFDVNRAALRQAFPVISDFVKVSAKESWGFEEVPPLIWKALKRCDLYKMNLPLNWSKAIGQILSGTGSHIPWNQVQQVYDSFSISKNVEQTILTNFMVDAGMIAALPIKKSPPDFLAYPAAISNFIQRFIMHKKLSKTAGLLSEGEYRHALSQAVDAPEKAEALDVLLRSGAILFPIPDGRYVLTENLPIEEPNHGFDLEKADTFVIPYRYINRSFIAKLLRSLRKFMNPGIIWASGALLKSEKSNAEALFRANESEGKVYFSFSDGQKDELISAIKKIMRNFHLPYHHLISPDTSQLGYREVLFEFDEVISHRLNQISEGNSMKLRQLQKESKQLDTLHSSQKSQEKHSLSGDSQQKPDKPKAKKEKEEKKDKTPDASKATEIIKYIIIAGLGIWALIFLIELLT
jgi:internalin A